MNTDLARKVKPLEEVIDVLTKDLKNGHVQRVQAGQCTLELGFIFNDLLSNLERVSDHCANIAITILESKDSHLLAHDYLGTLDLVNQDAYRYQLQHYTEKYVQVNK